MLVMTFAWSCAHAASRDAPACNLLIHRAGLLALMLVDRGPMSSLGMRRPAIYFSKEQTCRRLVLLLTRGPCCFSGRTGRQSISPGAGLLRQAIMFFVFDRGAMFVFGMPRPAFCFSMEPACW